jgi:hypothetical protein
MRGVEQHVRLHRALRTRGDHRRTLLLGNFPILIEGLDGTLCSELASRWGGFLHRSAPGTPRMTVRLFRGGPGYWLDAPSPGEPYRIETIQDGPEPLVASYHFAVGADERPDHWRVGITDGADESTQRILENAIRFVIAHLAVSEGGFALHAAGVLREQRAYLLAGPSRAGKSTAVGLLGPATSLGDDFAIVLPSEQGWTAPALPFDNSERAAADPPRGLFPVAGIWRLHQASKTRVEPLPPSRAVASLMSCTAFPWTMPERSAALLDHVRRFVTDASFHHLHFTKDSELWSFLV